MKTADPTGETWRVRRRWLPWRVRPREGADLSDPISTVRSGAIDDLGAVVAVLAVVALVVLVPFLFIGAFLAVEILVVLTLLSLFVLLRVVRIARWPISVRRGRRFAWEESVRGWRGSRKRIREIADAVARGQVDRVRPPDHEFPRHL